MASSCPVEVDGRQPIAALKHGSVHALIPVLRAALRYGPRGGWSQALWWRLVDPYFAWHSHRFVARTRFGSKVEGDTCEILQQHIYYFGAWEADLSQWIAGRLGTGDVCVDVGANAGYFSLLASDIVGDSGAVVAIEASPRVFEILQANLARNRARNVRPVNIAAADSSDTV